MRRTVERGFTLIELMIVVVIVAVLLLTLLPAYQDSLTKSRRADGMGALLDAANRQEKFLLDRNAYTDDMEDLGYSSDPQDSPEGYYSIAVREPNDPSCTLDSCYVLEATPVRVQAGDEDCTLFILDSRGNRDAEGDNAGQCWR